MKRFGLTIAHQDIGLFPPGKSGGLIEAASRLLGPGVGRLFPPGKSGGLIEAQRCGCASLRTWRPFPPGKSGGLIEAWLVSDYEDEYGPGFRRVNPAASLKPSAKNPGSLSSAPRFPPGKSGGLIEAPSRRYGHLPSRGFRRVNPAASLKPGS